jgi:hypothetical protein
MFALDNMPRLNVKIDEITSIQFFIRQNVCANWILILSFFQRFPRRIMPIIGFVTSILFLTHCCLEQCRIRINLLVYVILAAVSLKRQNNLPHTSFFNIRGYLLQYCSFRKWKLIKEYNQGSFQAIFNSSKTFISNLQPTFYCNIIKKMIIQNLETTFTNYTLFTKVC